MSEKICKLCKIKTADKLNSHIIPKFMCKRLFEDAKPRNAVMLTKEGSQKKLQDSPKENNILCISCEKRFEILETYFSGIFRDFNGLQNATRKYVLSIEYNQEILTCENLDPTLFKLFIFSLVWRASISKLLEFETFNLREDVEEELRVFLNTNLKSKHNDLLKLTSEITKIPRFHSCLIRPKNKTRGIFTAYEFREDSYAIYTVDYVLFFYIQNPPPIPEHALFSNREDQNVRIVFGKDEYWKSLNELVVNNMLNYRNNGISF